MITFADSSTCYLIYASISPRILDLLPLVGGTAARRFCFGGLNQFEYVNPCAKRETHRTAPPPQL
jgi:hypothetical protein